MSKKKTIFGILLILITFSTLIIAVIPNLYSNNSAGKMYKEVETNFHFLKNEKKDHVLLYFGYVGCTTICPPALNEISQIYNKLDKNKFAIYFINLQENTPKENVDQFAKVFHKNFKGIYLNKKEISEIISKLNVKYLPSMIDNNEIDHSGFLHYLKKNNNYNFFQKFIYTTRPFDIDFIVKDLKSI